MSPKNNHEAPVNERTIRFRILVLFHIQPKRLKNINKEWKQTKNMSSMCQIITDSVSVKFGKTSKIQKVTQHTTQSKNGITAQRQK
jgi:hypothetical protein